MSFFFDVYGPFKVHRDEDGYIYRSAQAMWEEVDEYHDELRSAIGCYMYCFRNGSNSTPWYVGMTIAKGGFYDEVLADHKINLLNDEAGRKGHRELFLFPLMTGDAGDSRRFSRSRKSKRSVIQWLERILMGMALERNPELLNTKDCTLPRSVTVRGLIGERKQGRPAHDVARARQALFGN